LRKTAMRRLAVRRRQSMLNAMVHTSLYARLARSLAALVVACASTARADEPTAAALPNAPAAIVHAYGEYSADCLEWTDSCTICRRTENSETACSTPGIACQPREIACSVRRQGGGSGPTSK
jgi:hypothetical protein